MARAAFVAIFALALLLPCAAPAASPLPRSGLPGDCYGDGQVSIGEVQKAVNMFLGILPPACGVDANGDGQISIGEVQRVINGFLGLIQVFTLHASAGDGGTIYPAGDILAAQGSSQAFAITPNLGMAIGDVLVDETSAGQVPSYTFDNIQADHAIAASFTPLCAPPQVTKQPQGQEVAHGAAATLTVEASGTMPLSYLWYLGESGDEGHPIPSAILPSYTTPPLTESASYWVKVSNTCGEAESTTAVVTAGAPLSAAATANPSSGTVPLAVAFTCEPAGGKEPYTFNWDFGDAGTSTEHSPNHTYTSVGMFHYTLTVTDALSSTASADGNVIASSVPTYTLTVNLGAGTEGTPATTATYPQGTVVNYSYSALACYGSLAVTLDGASAPASGSVTMNGDHTLAVSASILMYTITASAGTGGTISPSGPVPVNCGANQAFAITPGGGYQILDVLVDGASAGKVSSYTFTNVTANHTIAASFVPTLSATCSATPVPPPAITSFTASPAFIQAGSSSTLSWTTTGATSCSINNGVGSVALSGAKSVSPASTATYTLTATGAGGTASAKVTVTVNHPPQIPTLTADSPIFVGDHSIIAGTTFDEDTDVVSWIVIVDSSSTLPGLFYGPTSGTGSIVGDVQALSAGNLVIRANVNDGKGGTATRTVTIVVM